jgi:hypothetical protein
MANGNGGFIPARVVSSTAALIPEVLELTTVLELTIELTPTGGTTEPQTFTAAEANPRGDVT